MVVALLGVLQFIHVVREAVDGGEDFHERHNAVVGEVLLQRLGAALFLLGRRESEAAVLLELDVGILPLRNVAVGEEILLVKGLVQFLERFPGIDEAL
jgi:hypothetical protein